MIIEIHGGGFKNKGAELMLVSVIKEFSENHPDVKFCINPSINDDKLYCEKYNILQYVKVPKARGGRLFPARFFLNRLLSNFIPKSYCNRNGLVRFKDVDALIDISGVRFSDKASSTAGKNFVLLAKYFNQRGKPVILLPQMFGPFNKFDSLNLVRKMSNEVDLVFARDKVSYDFLNKFIPMNNHIFQAPDITISNKIKNVEGKCSKNYGCIVPNVRIFDRGDSAWKKKYISRLVLAARKMNSAGMKPIILIHSIDGSEDKPIAEAVQELVGNDICSIKQADDPLETKRFISESQLLVGSRYHSIVSALSSGVPAIVMGWAHKYETILKDFGMEDFIHRADDEESDFVSILDYMLDINNNRELRILLDKKINPMITENEKMWEKVYITLGF